MLTTNFTFDNKQKLRKSLNEPIALFAPSRQIVEPFEITFRFRFKFSKFYFFVVYGFSSRLGLKNNWRFMRIFDSCLVQFLQFNKVFLCPFFRAYKSKHGLLIVAISIPNLGICSSSLFERAPTLDPSQTGLGPTIYSFTIPGCCTALISCWQ